MSKKGENIYKRKDDRWEARYERGREYDGRVLYGYCYGRTYKEAREKQRAAEKGLARTKACYGAGFSRYCREWLEVRRVAIKESSVQKYEGEIERYISPNLGGLDPTFITAGDMAEMARRLLGGGLSPKSVNDVLTLTYTILKYARRRLGITTPPEKFERVSEHKRETRVLCGEEQKRLMCELDEGQNREKFGILLAIKTGMRIGELCALRQRDVAVGEGVIYVRSTMQRVKNRDGGAKTKITITQPKSKQSYRVIPMTESTAALCKRYAVNDPDAFVLTGKSDKFIEPRRMQTAFAAITRKCGLEGVHFHTLRHTFATRCVEAGFEIKSLSEILGHASPQTTLIRYVHPSLALKRENMEKLEKFGL